MSQTRGTPVAKPNQGRRVGRSSRVGASMPGAAVAAAEAVVTAFARPAGPHNRVRQCGHCVNRYLSVCSGVTGSCTVTRSPSAGRGVRASAPWRAGPADRVSRASPASAARRRPSPASRHTAGQLLNETGHVRVPPARTRTDHRRTYVSAVMWPHQGQAALALGNGQHAASPNEQPVPIASLAKVMTAYLTLKRYPLVGAQDGFTITISETDAQDEVQDAAENQSGVAVAAVGQLTGSSWSSPLPPRAVKAHWARPGAVVHRWEPLARQWLGSASTATRCLSLSSELMSTQTRPIGAHVNGKRRSLSAIALIGVAGVIGVCGSAALAGTGRGSSAADTNAVSHEKAVEVAHARVSTPTAPAGSLPSGSPASPYKPDPSTSSRSSAPSPTGKLPSSAHSSLPAIRRTAAGPGRWPPLSSSG
jgi:hypothetical protein